MNKRFFIIFSCLCLIILAINIVTTYYFVSHLFNALNIRRSELNEIYNYENYLSYLKDAETGQRGFIITQNEAYLEPYESAREYFDSPKIKNFFEDEIEESDPETAMQISQIPWFTEKKMEEIERIIQIMKEKGFKEAQKEVKTQTGKKLMDQLRILVGSVIDLKQKRVENMDVAIQKSMNNTFRLLMISNTAGGIILGICLCAIFKSSQKLKAKEQELLLTLEKLSESSAIKEGILNSANYAIISASPEGIITSFNPAAEKMLGYKKEELIGLQTPKIFHDAKEIEARSLVLSTQLKRKVAIGFESFIALAKEGMADCNEWTYIHKNGERFPVSLCVTANKNEKGEIIGYLGIAYDITERKKIDQMKNELIAVTSHEIRSPLVAIKGTFDLLSQPECALNEQAKNILEIGRKNCIHLVRLTEDILDVQKIEMGKVQFNFKKINVESFLSQALLSLTLVAQQSHVSLVYTPPLEQATIKVDEDRLIQVMNNLISNAINSSPQGSTVEIKAEKVHSKMRFEIMDQGKGMSEEMQSKISEQITANSHGQISSCFGLNIAKTIIEKHNGTLHFQTNSRGTTFWFDLPLEEI